MRYFAVIALVLVGSSQLSVSPAIAQDAVERTSQTPFTVHPDNPRYFLFRQQPTVLVTSAEHYGVLLNKAFDFHAYFTELAAHGLNHSRVFSGAYRENSSSFNITENTLAPKTDNYVCPWQTAKERQADGSPKFDLTRWNDAYFQRLRDIVSEASQRGIVLELTLFCPMYSPDLWEINPMNSRNNVNGVGDCSSLEVYTAEREDLLKVQTALTQKLVAELAEFDNIFYEVCNEPYFGGVTEAWQHRIIDAVVEAQQKLGCKKLISLNVANKTQRIDKPHPAVSLFNFHYCHPPIVLQENAHLGKAIGENETGFRGSADFLYRTEGWDFLVAGGTLYNNLDYSFSASHPAGTLTGYASPGGGSLALRQQLSILKQHIDALPLPHVEPMAASFVTSSPELVCSAIGKTRAAYLLYAHVKVPDNLRDESPEKYLKTLDSVTLTVDLPQGDYHATQINTLTGETQTLPMIRSTDSKATLKLNAFQTDVAIEVRAAN